MDSNSLQLFVAFFLGALSAGLLIWVFLAAVPTFLTFRQTKIKDQRRRLDIEYNALLEKKKKLDAAKKERLREQGSLAVDFSAADVNTAIAAERLRISHELHDDIVQRMAAVRLRMEELSYRLDKPDLLEVVNGLSEDLNQTIKSLRFVIYGLPQPQFEQNSFSKLVKDSLVARLNRVAGKAVDFHLENEQGEFALSERVKRELYHLVQEAVQNSLKHSAGFHLKLSVSWNSKLEIEVTDDGQGYLSQVGASSGLGFSSMVERANAIGATLQLIPSTFGSIVRLTLPGPGLPTKK